MTGAEELNTELQKITFKLESTFENIYRERMNDMPVVNDQIGVHAVSFQKWEQLYLGVMVTPWFMNLMLLPIIPETWKHKQILSYSTYNFPSGQYKFLTGFEPRIGKYQTCSLFSPMFAFSNNAAALETAEIVLKELINPENFEADEIQSSHIEQLWYGETPEALSEPDEVKDNPALTEKMNRRITRRQLIRGSLMRADQHDE